MPYVYQYGNSARKPKPLNMGKIRGNVATRGFSGKVGSTLVYRDGPGSVTYVAAAPKPSRKAPSEAQELQKDRFQLASLFADRTKANVTLWSEYAAKAKLKNYRSTRNIVIADYFNVPRIWSFDFTQYTGQPASVITVLVSCLLRAKSVKFVIYNTDGSELENGDATPEPDNQTWKYTTTSTNDSLAGSRIVVTVLTLPGNVSSEEITIK